MDILENNKWTDSEWLSYVQERLSLMKNKKNDYETAFRKYEVQNNALSFYGSDGELNVNVPLEKTLREIYMGRTDGKVTYDIIPDGQANIEELQPAKYTLTHFIDGNERENFWKENREFRDQKSTYGTGIWFCGLRSEKDFVYQLKDKNKVHTQKELMDEKSYTRIDNERFLFFPQTIHPMDFYIDDKAYGQSDIQYAEDCIRKEKISKLEFEMRYKDYIDIAKVSTGSDSAEQNQNSKSVNNDEIILHHYYHRILKKYFVMANETTAVINGLFLYGDGKLPFVTAHHYFRSDRFWGEGIPERVAYLKAYKSEVFQDILAGSAMSSGIHLLAGNDAQIGQDWNLGGRQMNIWRTTGGAEDVKPIPTSPNLSYFVAVMDMIDKQIAIDSGINAMEQFDPGSDKVGIVEIMEANKSVRNRSVDESYNLALDDALTQILSLIKQYAPAVMSKTIYGKDKKPLKVTWYPIRIDGYEVENKGKKQSFKESVGSFGYFELKPGTLFGSGVKVTTPSTNSLLPILERQKVNEYLDNITKMATVAQIGGAEQLQKLNEVFNVSEVMDWMSDAYGYDTNGLKAFTEKDKLRKEIIEKSDKLKSILTISQNDPANPTLPLSPTSSTELVGTGQAMGGLTPEAPPVGIGI